jgi:glycosyltransferase involved in cell wall biosynthesis
MQPPDPQVTILLALYNGGATLAEQLASLASQTHANWRLIVSDDGSQDTSLATLARFAADLPAPQVRLMMGPARGSAWNFRHMIGALTDRVDHVAFCDQDDVWLPDKLARAVAALARCPADLPALYCSRTVICDAALTGRRPSRLPSRPPAFRNALVQNIAGGNTIVLNPAAARLARQAHRDAGPVVEHDWWLYQVVTGAGGTVVYDPTPSVLYRQHGGNQIGANDTLGACARRLCMVLAGRFQGWNSINIAALEATIHRLTPENRALLAQFAALRLAPLPRRLLLLAQSGLFRQGRGGQAGLWMATILRRI